MAGQEQLIPQSVTDFSHNEKMLITILSIDGGGVRGLISAVILTFLEQQLQVRIFCISLQSRRRYIYWKWKKLGVFFLMWSLHSIKNVKFSIFRYPKIIVTHLARKIK